jgi:hypothetical protein
VGNVRSRMFLPLNKFLGIRDASTTMQSSNIASRDFERGEI